MMTERIKAGRGRLKDLDLLLEIGDSIGIMPGTTICGLADGAAWPLKTTIRKFRQELEDFVRRTNPRGYAEAKPVEAMRAGGHAGETASGMDGRPQGRSQSSNLRSQISNP
jgi:NADH-quinone oxidoreductase subunit F